VPIPRLCIEKKEKEKKNRGEREKEVGWYP
jgi:hypothetical protein